WMKSAVIRIMIEKTKDSARRMSSRKAGIGRTRTAMIATTPMASPALDWRRTSKISLILPSGEAPEAVALGVVSVMAEGAAWLEGVVGCGTPAPAAPCAGRADGARGGGRGAAMVMRR